MILNGLGFVSAPLYWYGAFFSGKATRHLLGEAVEPEHLNDDYLGPAINRIKPLSLSASKPSLNSGKSMGYWFQIVRCIAKTISANWGTCAGLPEFPSL
jgi:hypothetical protein